MRIVPIFALGVWLAGAATLEKLSEEDLIRKSTEIVEGRVISTGALQRGPVVYTTYRIQVKETLKGAAAGTVDVAVMGGRFGNVVQNFSGSPVLTEGQEYLLFLWTSRSGLTQVIGLSQGLFQMKQSTGGEPMIYRAASTETMLDGEGKPVVDTPVTMRYRDMVTRIRTTLEAGARR